MTTASTAARAPASTPARGAAMEERAAATAPAAFPLAAEDAAGLPSRAAADRDAAQLRRRWAERMTGRPPFPRPLRAEPPAFFPRPRAVARGCGTLFELAAFADTPRAVARGCGAAAAPAPRAASGWGAVPAGPSPGAWAGAPGASSRARAEPPLRAPGVAADRRPCSRGAPSRSGRLASPFLGVARRERAPAAARGRRGRARRRPRARPSRPAPPRRRPRPAPRGAGGRGAAGGEARRPRAPPHAERPAPCGLERVPPSVELLGGAEARLAAPRATAVHLRHPRA